MPKLADPQAEIFAKKYALTRNGPLAAREAGYPEGKPYIQVLELAAVTARVRELWGSAMAATGVTAERVMRELERIAFQDIRSPFTANGELKPVHELDDDTAATIGSIDVETRWEGKGENAVPVQVTKIRRVDKMPALNILAKHFKIVGDDNEGVNALASALADRLKAARERAFATPPSSPRATRGADVVEGTESVEDATSQRLVFPAAIATPEAPELNPLPPPKRGVGRPRKHAPPPADQPKRGRGRPRKQVPATMPAAPRAPAPAPTLAPTLTPTPPQESNDEQLW